MNLLAKPGTSLNCHQCAGAEDCNVASAHDYKVGECLFYTPKVRPRTNGDRLRAMSDKALVNFIYHFDPKKIHEESMLKWMGQEVTEDEL